MVAAGFGVFGRNPSPLLEAQAFVTGSLIFSPAIKVRKPPRGNLWYVAKRTRHVVISLRPLPVTTTFIGVGHLSRPSLFLSATVAGPIRRQEQSQHISRCLYPAPSSPLRFHIGRAGVEPVLRAAESSSKPSRSQTFVGIFDRWHAHRFLEPRRTRTLRLKIHQHDFQLFGPLAFASASDRHL